MIARSLGVWASVCGLWPVVELVQAQVQSSKSGGLSHYMSVYI